MHSEKACCSKSFGTPIKRSRRKDARPGELLASALALFIEKGYAATRVEEIATHAGVSKGTLFLYFQTKEELFKAVVRDSIANHFPRWSAELEAFKGSTPDMLRTAVNMWWNSIGNTQATGITKLMMSEAVNFPELAIFYQKEVVEPGHELIRRILQRGVDRQEFKVVDMNYGVYTILAPMMLLVMWKHSLGTCIPAYEQFDPQDFLSAQVETILHGLMPCPTTPTVSRKTRSVKR